MELLRWKARLSVLWVFIAVGMSAVMILRFMMPGVIEEVMVGESEGMMVAYAFFWLVPLAVAVLCLTLKDSLNRWTNFVLGILLGLFFIICEIIVPVIQRDAVSVALWLMIIAGLLVSFFIAWFAWKWPEYEA